MCQHNPFAKVTAVAALIMATAGPAFAQTTDMDRHERGEAMIRTLNAGESQATLENTAYERLRKSDVKYRFVIDMASLKEGSAA